MADLRFGAFLAPHHPIGEHPTLQIQSDLKLAKRLDRLGYDEFWVGEAKTPFFQDSCATTSAFS